MSNLLMNTFNQRVVATDRKLKELEKHGSPVIGYDPIAEWNVAVNRIHGLLTKLRSFALDMDIYELVAPTLYELQQRMERLPYVPPITCLTRAQNILQLQPHVIMTKDIKHGEQEPPELRRVMVMANDHTVLFDQDFVSQQSQPLSFKHVPQRKNMSLSFPVIWKELTKALSGRYILAYDFSLVQAQLRITAERSHLPVPVLIGESFLDLYFEYLGPSVLSLGTEEPMLISTAVWEQLGSPFSSGTACSIGEQAKRILQLIQAIADGTLTMPTH